MSSASTCGCGPTRSSTPVAVSVAAALDYYESVGQNWERAAYHQGPRRGRRPARGGQAFLDELTAASSGGATSTSPPSPTSIRSSARSMITRSTTGSTAPGRRPQARPRRHPRDRVLRADPAADPGRPRSRPAIAPHPGRPAALARAGLRPGAAADELADAYGDAARAGAPGADDRRRADPRLPEATPSGAGSRRCRRPRLCAGSTPRSTHAASAVNGRYGELFAEEEPLSSRFGSLVFTGVEDDPETLPRSSGWGFSDPPPVAETIRGLAPRPHRRHPHRARARAVHPPGAAPAGGGPRHRRAGRRLRPLLRLLLRPLPSGVQVQSLFLAQPRAVRADRAGHGLRAPAGRAPWRAGRRRWTPCSTRPFRALRARRAGRSTPALRGRRRLRGGHGRRAAPAPRAGLPHRCAGDWPGPRPPPRPARPSPTWPTPASAASRRGPGRGRAAGRRLSRRRGGGRPGQVRFARDDRWLGPGPDDRLPSADARRGVGAQGLGRRHLLRPLHPAPDRRAFRRRPPRAGSTRSTCGCAPRAPPGPVAVSLGGVRRLLCRRGGDLGVPGPDARARGLVQLGPLRRPRRRGLSRPRCARRETLAARRRRAGDARADGTRAAAVRLLGSEARAGGLVDIEFAAQFLQIIHAADGGPLRPIPPRPWKRSREAGLAPPGCWTTSRAPGDCSRTCRSC